MTTSRRKSVEEVIADLQAEGESTPGLLFPWWKRAALDSIAKKHTFFICGPDAAVYLARYWLSTPVGDKEHFMSSNSIVLHQFLRGDDDRAPHDHPAWFRVKVLEGAYTEYQTPKWWDENTNPYKYGPLLSELVPVLRTAGDTYEKSINQAHIVKNPEPSTWSLVTTGPKQQDWGFYPEDAPKVPWQQFPAGP